MNKPFKVSVVMLAYNHEQFIAQAIESILAQETHFPFQLIIGEDKSPDGTLNICRKYQSQHPDKIQLLSDGPNLGPQPNFKRCYDIAQDSSEYLAFCEGDDYWVDSLKLQKQVDFMESEKDYAICFGNSRVEYYDQSLAPYFLNEGIKKDTFTLDDLIGEEEVWFMGTASLLYRISCIGELPSWFLKCKSGDIPLAILAARNGNIKYLDLVFSAYRKHSGGISLTDHKDQAAFIENRIFMYSNLNRETGFKYNKRFKINLGGYVYLLLNSKEYKNSYLKKLPQSLKYIFLTFPKIPHLKLFLRDHLTPPFLLAISRFFKKLVGIIPS